MHQQQNVFFDYLATLAHLSQDYIDELTANSTVKHIEKEVIYFDKGNYSDKMGFLLKGVMRIYDLDPSGDEWNKVFLSTPSFVLGNPRLEEKAPHFVETITPCEVLELPINFIKKCLSAYPEAREIQTKILHQLFEKKSKREFDFLTLTAKERYLKYRKEYWHVIEDIPQYHIARYLGITTTQLSRINVALKNQQM